MITAVVLILLISAVYLLNTVKKTSDLDALFLNILKFKPDTVSFCLGKNESSGKYNNVVLDNNGKAIVRQDTYPVGMDGAFIIVKDHGEVSELPDGSGFKISGIDLVEFKCPDGFEGINCRLKALCGDDDVGNLKPITYAQFNELGLYTNAFVRSPISSFARIIEQTHPRIRLLCLDNLGNFELQTCPNNTLLDQDLKCQPYDICSDRINGYRHNYKISSTSADLDTNQYYICNNNVSTLTTCSEGTLFSMANSGCISESICFNRATDTIAVDDNSYIQCANDQGTRVTCDIGIDDTNGVLSCIVDTCIPQTFSFDDGMLSFTYGNTLCDNRVSNTKICNNAPNPRVYNYEWAEKFTYSIDSWPTEVMDENRNCVAPTDSIVTNPIIQLGWTDAMLEAHDYNILSEKYICPDNTKYIINYKTQTVDPEPNGIINHLSPCQNEIIDSSNFPFPLYASTLPPLAIVMYTPCYIKNPEIWPMWPIKNDSTLSYLSATITISPSSITVARLSTANLPYGFLDPVESGEMQPLRYAGYQNITLEPNSLYYVFTSGTLDFPTLHDATVEDTKIFPIMTEVDTKQSVDFAINMNNIDESKRIFTLPTVTFERDQFSINDIPYKAGYVTMSIDYTSDTSATLTIGNFDPIQFVPNSTPKFTF